MILDRLLDPDMPATLVWFVLLWLFAVGACIGSFMNVVIYRLPAGLSLLHPPSRCPVCETPIAASDNLPIFGWIWLRGRCRRCHAPISPRYPTVELLVAVLFVALASVELLSPATSLTRLGLTMAESWGVYAYHAFLLCSLMCAAFIEFDGYRLPARLTIPIVIVGFGASLAWPHLRPMAPASGNAVDDGLIGIAAGAMLGLACWPASVITSAHRTTLRDSVVALANVGAFLGWQAVSGVAMIAAALRLLAVFMGRAVPVIGRVGYIGCVFAATLAWVAAGIAISDRLPWIGVKAGVTIWLAALACVFVLALATRVK